MLRLGSRSGWPVRRAGVAASTLSTTDQGRSPWSSLSRGPDGADGRPRSPGGGLIVRIPRIAASADRASGSHSVVNYAATQRISRPDRRSRRGIIGAGPCCTPRSPRPTSSRRSSALCPHHHFGPMKIGMSIDRSPALSPAGVSHPPRPGQAADRHWKPHSSTVRPRSSAGTALAAACTHCPPDPTSRRSGSPAEPAPPAVDTRWRPDPNHSPFWQSSDYAEPAAGVTSDRAAIGARAAVRIVERRMSCPMTSACPSQGILKPLGWTRRICAWMQVDLVGAAEMTTHRRQSPERAPDSLRQQTAADAAAANSAPRADPLDRYCAVTQRDTPLLE